MLNRFSPPLQQYLLITANYWAFTLTDGALRMLIVLHFYSLGYSGLSLALLLVFYEVFGVVTNLVGGWLGARLGLNTTMHIGMTLQIIALAMLLLPPQYLLVPWVMAAQALSGIAKDLNKMSAKSSLKLLVPAHAQATLFNWVAMLTGSKNALKGVGFFLGGSLLTLLGFRGAIFCLILILAVVSLFSLWRLSADLGKSNTKPKFTQLLSKSAAINVLSAARLLLFGARDVWFVIALPLTLASQFGWSHWAVGSFLALWVIGYGAVQSITPLITRHRLGKPAVDGLTLTYWALLLAVIPALIALSLQYWPTEVGLLLGLLLFGAVFAVNSALHSYMIVRCANADGVSLDVGFYYMANALGRLIGTLLSGWIYQQAGLSACLWWSSAMLVATVVVSARLPQPQA
jgi:predicted MFS family arabinose efflux permease